MRIDLCLLGVAGVVWFAGAACSSSSSTSGHAEAGAASTLAGASNTGGSASAGASGSTQAGAPSTTAGSSGAAHDAGASNAGSGGLASAGRGGSMSVGGAGSAGAAGAYQPGSAGLPSNLDPNACASVVYVDEGPDSAAQRSMCNQCCNQASFDSFGSYNDKCMCGTSVKANETICPQSTDAACKTCCVGAGYPQSTTTSTTCYCYGFDCGSGLSTTGCLNCCTEHGFLAWGGYNDKCVCTQ